MESLHEFNPMLGFRGCRLGIVFPEITEMQSRAIFQAAANVRKQGKKVEPEVMIPLVGNVKELEHQAAIVRRVAGANRATAFAALGDGRVAAGNPANRPRGLGQFQLCSRGLHRLPDLPWAMAATG